MLGPHVDVPVDLTLLASEASTCHVRDIRGGTFPHEPGEDEALGGSGARVAMPWMVSNTCCLKVEGTTGLKTPVLMSLRRGWASTYCVLRCRLDLARKAATSGHTSWAAARRQ